MAGKKYFWLKLKKDFFKRHDIQIIESMPNGKDYILFYLKMLLESVDHNGNLRFSDVIPYNESMLSTITNTNVDTVKSAMKVFTDLKMIEILDDQTIFMAEVEKMLGTETYWAEQKRQQRVEDNFKHIKKLSYEQLQLPNGKVQYVDNKRYGGNAFIAFEKAKGKCQKCGTYNDLCIHHMNGYSNELEDLMILCRKCHRSVEVSESSTEIGNCPTNVLSLSNVSNQEIDIEKDIEIELEIKKDNKSSPFKFFENERFGILTPFIADKIGNWIDDTSEEVVIKALGIAVSNDKRTWKYAEAILQSWYSKGLKTLTDIEAQEKEYERQKLNKQSYKQRGKQEIIPEFMQPNYVAEERQKSDEELAEFEKEMERLLRGEK